MFYYYSSEFNQRDAASKLADIRGKIISEFVEKPESKTIAAIKLAEYGEQALPAVKMALGADDLRLRSGAAAVLQQMYRAPEKVERTDLLSKVLEWNDKTKNPFLHRGVLEWLVEMKSQLSDEESQRVFERVSSNLEVDFGATAENCAKQDGEFALQAAIFLYTWSLKKSRDLVMGMLKHCIATDQPYESAREQAANTLPMIARQLRKSERDSIVADLQQLSPTAPLKLRTLIEAAASEIRVIQTP